jgi:hypothetical protein
VVFAAPDVGAHVTAAPKLVLPFENWIVPVGPAPLLVVTSYAVSLTIVPAVIEVKLLPTAVVVVAFVIVTASVLLLAAV